MNTFFRRYSRNWGAVFGLIVILFVCFLAIAAPYIYEESPWMMVAAPLIPP